MLLSMTGYGAAQQSKDGRSVSVEIRTVNNRYIKMHSRISDGYAMLEPRMEETIRQHIRRGAVQLNVDVRHAATSEDLQINNEFLNFYVDQLETLSKDLASRSVASNLDPANIIGLPGVVSDKRKQSIEADADWPLIQSCLEAALKELTAMREVEGLAMAKDLLAQIEHIGNCAAEVETLAPQVVSAYETRLTERINKLLQQHGAEITSADVVREVGVFSERADISEEVVRLRSHLDQFRKIMSSKEPAAGRKLEFLVQELLRETNTIGSKANNADIAKHVVEAKTSIERIREMVQNVE